MKLPFGPRELMEFFDRYIEEHKILDSEVKRRLWWAMFYCAKEGIDWKENLG